MVSTRLLTMCREWWDKILQYFCHGESMSRIWEKDPLGGVGNDKSGGHAPDDSSIPGIKVRYPFLVGTTQKAKKKRI